MIRKYFGNSVITSHGKNKVIFNNEIVPIYSNYEG